MNSRIRLALRACGAALIFATGAVAEMRPEASIPDPGHAWEMRDLSPLEDWLASSNGNAGAHDDDDSGASVAVLRARAWLARRDGEVERALSLIDQAIDMAPDRPDLRVDRAAFRSDRIEESGPLKSLRIARDVRSDLEHALAVAPDHADALAALAAFHLRAPGIAGGDKDEAAALLARLGELAPLRRTFREAIELAEEERFAEAVERIALALSQADRARPDWRVRMGDWLHRMGRNEDALEAYRRALLEAPRHAGALYALGRTSAESGLAADAGINALQRFLAQPRWPQDPEPKLAWWQLGRIHARAGCAEEARAAFRRAMALDPDWRAPGRALERLGTDVGADESLDCTAGTRQVQVPAG